jgi:two-component system, NarL family, sensor kinase
VVVRSEEETGSAWYDRSVTPDQRAANRGVALLRLGFLPLALLELSTSHRELGRDFFPLVVALFAVYALTLLGLVYAGSLKPPPPPLVQALVDLAFISMMVYTSGGAASPLRFAFYVLPIVAAVRLSPRTTATWAGVALLAFLAVTLPHPGTDLSSEGDLLAREGLALAWIGAAAVMLSVLVARRERALVELAASRRRLVQQSLDAEARERRRLAQALHDEAIQNVLVARQEITDMAHGVPGAAERAQFAIDETHRQLRDEVFAMHPVGLERAGLAAVLRRLGDEAGRRGGFEVHLDVDPDAADATDDLVMFVARELLANAAKHARASRVDIEVRSERQGLRLVIRDDGVGFARERLELALADGHIGLASVTERVRAAGGDLTIESDEGAGTRIAATFPGGAG